MAVTILPTTFEARKRFVNYWAGGGAVCVGGPPLNRAAVPRNSPLPLPRRPRPPSGEASLFV